MSGIQDRAGNPMQTTAHGVGVAAIAALVAVIITLVTATVYLGGTLRQVETNTGRLDRLESIGSPAVKSLAVELDLAIRRLNVIEQNTRDLPINDAKNETEIARNKADVNDIRRDLRSRDFWERLAGDIARINAQIEQLNAVRERAVGEWALLVQRVATLEAEAATLTQMNVRTRDYIQGHERDDLGGLRSELERLHRELEMERLKK